MQIGSYSANLMLKFLMKLVYSLKIPIFSSNAFLVDVCLKFSHIGVEFNILGHRSKIQIYIPVKK